MGPRNQKLAIVSQKKRITFSGQVSDLTQMSKCLKWPKNQESKGLYPWGATWTKTTHASVHCGTHNKEMSGPPKLVSGIGSNIVELILTSVNLRRPDGELEDLEAPENMLCLYFLLKHSILILQRIGLVIIQPNHHQHHNEARSSLWWPQYFIILVRIQISFVSRGGQPARTTNPLTRRQSNALDFTLFQDADKISKCRNWCQPIRSHDFAISSHQNCLPRQVQI